MSNTVLVTGISGFLGGHVALTLLKSGYHVRGSIRNLQRADKVRATLAKHGANVHNLEIVSLDLTKDAGWADAMQGVQYLVHTASPFVTSMPNDKMDLIRPAVEGTERAINAALAANVERIVLTSSSIAIMAGHGENRPAKFDASHWTNYENGAANAYAESKTRAEQRAWELMDIANRHDDLAVLNPGLILGPLLDEDPGTSGALILRFLQGSVPAAPNLQMHAIDVRDLSELHMLALQDPRARGKRLPVVSGDFTLLEGAKILAKHFPSYRNKMPKFQMPNWAVRIYAVFDKDARGALNDLGKRSEIDTSIAEKILPHPLISAENSVVAMAQSLIDEKLV